MDIVKLKSCSIFCFYSHVMEFNYSLYLNNIICRLAQLLYPQNYREILFYCKI
jgi:hypothetical protein